MGREYNDEFHGKAEVAGFIALTLQKVSYDATCYSHTKLTRVGIGYVCVCLVRWMTFKINYVSEKRTY